MAPKPMTRRNFLAAVGAGTGALLILPAWASAEELTPDAVFRDPDQPVLGNPDGDVTVAEFFDYQCPFCKKDHTIVQSFVKGDGNVRLVMKDWPIFGASSVKASQLVLGASVLGQYAKAHDALMSTQGRLSDADVTRVLSEADIDVTKADAAYRGDRARWDALLTRNAAQADALGLRGTPAFVIGTVIYPGLMDAAALKKAVARARN